MRTRSLLLLICGTWGMLEAPPLQAQVDLPRATLHLQILDPFGKVRHDEMSIHLVSKDATKDFTPNGHGSIVGVPYGTYTLNVGWGLVSREVTVNCEQLWVRVGVPFVIGDHAWPPGGISIIGTIDPAPKTKDWWARLEGVYLSDRREVPVAKGGRFAIWGSIRACIC